MINNDYSQLEIDNVIESLLTVHFGKLKCEELAFIDTVNGHRLTQNQRDVLIKLYDAVSEGGD